MSETAAPPAPPESSTAAELVRIEQETAVCRCGQPFERTVTVIGVARVGPSVCPACEEADRIRERDYAEARAPKPTNALDHLAAIGVNVRVFGRLTLEEMLKEPAIVAAFGFVHEVTKAKPHDFVQGLYFAGPTGTGKTQLAVSTLRALLDWGYQGRIVFDRARALVTTIQDRYGQGNVDDVIEKRRNAGLWVLDDIGTEKPTPDALRIIEDVLDARQGHPTILTSNESPAELAQRWAPHDTQGRFASRLGPMNYRHIVLDGDDRRFQ